MHTIEIIGGCIKIDGQPYQRGDLDVFYTTNGVRIRRKLFPDKNIFTESYDNITDPVTGDPYEDLDALKSFCDNNFFVDAPVTGGALKSSVTVDAYSDMIAMLGNVPVDFLVLNDESKGMENSVYQYFINPGGDPILMRIAAVKEDI